MEIREVRLTLYAVLVGVLITVIGSLAIEFGNQIIQSPSDHAVVLNGFAEVIEKAASVVQTADLTLNIAVDMPAYGCISENKAYRSYKDQVSEAVKRNGLSIEFMSFSPTLDRIYRDSVEHLDAIQDSMADIESADMRRLLSKSRVDIVDAPWLSFINLFVSRDSDGRYRTVIAYIEGIRAPATVKGIYSESAEVGVMAIELFKTLKARNLSSPSPDKELFKTIFLSSK